MKLSTYRVGERAATVLMWGAFLLAFVLALSALNGCTWLDSQSFETCYVYRGREICARRINGVWSFSVDLTAGEREAIVKDIEGR